MTDLKISFIPSPKHVAAQEACQDLVKKYPDSSPEKADVFVVLGGDGTMLHALHEYGVFKKPFFGMNLGTVGFLMNSFESDNLPERLHQAIQTQIQPLVMKGLDTRQVPFQSHAFNEVSLLRQTHQAAKIKLFIDGILRLDDLIADGILVSTPVGSTAYNLSNKGPILPVNSGLLALTPISPFRPRHLQSALLKQSVDITIEILSPHHRPVSATADFNETRHVQNLSIKQDNTQHVTLLFDPKNNLEERIFQEQFRQ